MQIVTTYTKVYTFDELTESTKERAIEKLRYWDVEHGWWEFIEDWVREAGDIMGIRVDKMYFSGFASRGDGACIEGAYYYAPKAVQKLQEIYRDEELFDIARRLQDVQRRNFYGLSARTRHRGHYYHSLCTDIEVFHDERDVSSETESEVQEILRDFMDWIYRKLGQEYDHMTSDEYIRDMIEANDYTFTEDGEIY